MKALLDTDVILDLLFEREQFFETAERLVQMHYQNLFDGYVSGITPVNVFYIGRKLRGVESARLAVSKILTTFGICPINEAILDKARTLVITDYEDAVQHAAAEAAGLEAIITRDLKDYKHSTLPVYSPGDFVNFVSRTK